MDIKISINYKKWKFFIKKIDEFDKKIIIEDTVEYQKNIKPKLWEHVPIIGAILYLIRVNFDAEDMESQLLSDIMQKLLLKFVIYTLLIFWFLILFLLPWAYYKILLRGTEITIDIYKNFDTTSDNLKI